jgi:hypothetical protein
MHPINQIMVSVYRFVIKLYYTFGTYKLIPLFNIYILKNSDQNTSSMLLKKKIQVVYSDHKNPNIIFIQTYDPYI